jgi:putative membrane-bound dehydrogenase-like protein
LHVFYLVEAILRVLLFLTLIAISLPVMAVELLKPDVVQHAGLTPQEAVKAITLPPGFKVTLFAAEPDIVQPVAFTFDDRGRLWVAEANNYPTKAPAGKGQDRILIFEDSTGAGHFDKKTVFCEGLNLVSGIEVGFGGVWVGQAPELLFIPILEGDKAGKPEVLLNGFAYGDSHETLNSFNWGPDGWLYGCHGVFNQSKVGKPGAADKDRIPMNAAVWRFHPTKKIFEIFAEGGSNQWGIDWDEHGQMFMTCCVIPHLYHVIQGGRYQRQAGEHADPYTFGDIKTIADHLHWDTGAANQWAANGKSGSFGGGHAHAGAMIYQGDNFPPEYRGRIFMSNIHGNRINTDILEPKGSGFVGHHGADFMLMNDSWSRLISMKCGPDGAMYVIDWYDKQACHLNKPEMFDRTNGRIYRVTYGEPQAAKVDLATMSENSLFKESLQNANEWRARHARRLLHERVAPDPKGFLERAHAVSDTGADGSPAQSLRFEWYAHLVPLTDEHAQQTDLERLKDGNEYVRAWAIQLLSEGGHVSMPVLEQFRRLAGEDKSTIVRAYLASAMARLPQEQRWDVMRALLTHGEDTADHNLPLMYWYAIETCVSANVERAAGLAAECKIPLVREFILRRLAMMSDQPKAIAAAVSAVAAGGPADHAQSLKGMIDGFAGKRKVAMPDNWPAIYDEFSKSPSGEVKQLALTVATIFGDPRAMATLRKTLADPAAEIGERQRALDSLLGAKDAGTLPVLQGLLSDAKMRGGAIRGLAAYDNGKTPGLLIASYGTLDPGSKLAALNTLASRPAWATQLVAAVQEKQIPAVDLTAPTIRNLHSLGDAGINDWIAKNWGSVRATADEKLKEIARYRAVLKPDQVSRANAENGRALFAKTCMQCHTLFDAGAKIGPDLTGSNRSNIDYLLENIIDPSAVIGKDYLMVNAKTKDGRFIDGIIKGQTADTITFATVSEVITLPKSEILSQKVSNVSMMPEGLLAGFREQEVRDLVKYLSGPGQVALPK